MSNDDDHPRKPMHSQRNTKTIQKFPIKQRLLTDLQVELSVEVITVIHSMGLN